MSASHAQTDPLERLLVIDRLEVGPPRLEPRRARTQYTVHQNGRQASSEFIYRFEDDVFDSKDDAALNLGAVMGAQVALNYGLFCREIQFHGSFDLADRRFLEAMAANTAREIFVKKLLEPNAFLKDSFPQLPPIKRDSYLQSVLRFADADAGKTTADGAPWSTDPGRIAVLSSSGKESLLSYALLHEIGRDVYSVFVNESGRHWFTALNAYRHFRENVPGTFRVWTNSDRLFAWMLSFLPFIREDFRRLRSDEYPVRLWTVAVFLFGALPLLSKHRVGRLVIGDEFDTTDRRLHEGIPHYNGLYDQSRYFDGALSRYFARKGWGVSQFSVLRPASELMVERVLLERYPALQRLQTSCHATHTDGDRVRPCGQCEKCMRVVGMLAALGGDPTACGYSDEQIRDCLDRLPQRGALQETPAQEHLAYLLVERNLVDRDRFTAMRPRKHEEIMKLRFDPERSPMDDIPVDLRRPLYRILLEHADGAVNRSGGAWVEFDPLAVPEIDAPYRFESPGVAPKVKP